MDKSDQRLTGDRFLLVLLHAGVVFSLAYGQNLWGKMSTVFDDRVSSGFRKRIFCMGLLVCCFFAGLIMRLGQIQLIEGTELSDAARRNFSRQLHLPAKRGAILDRSGQALAEHKPAFDLYITPAKVRDLDATLGAVGEVIDFDDLRWIEIYF